MDREGLRFLIKGQVCFLIGVISCILIKPVGLAANHGISYFSHFRTTLVPYILALWGSAFYLYRASKKITSVNLKPVATALSIVALLEVALVFAPDLSADRLIYHIHTIIGSLIYMDVLFISLRLLIKSSFDRWLLFFVGIQLLACVGTMMWDSGSPPGFLIQAEILFFMATMGMLAYYMSRFAGESLPQ